MVSCIPVTFEMLHMYTTQASSTMTVISVDSCVILSRLGIYWRRHNLHNTVKFHLGYIRITTKWGVASLQLPAEYPQLPVLLIGQIETLLKGCAYELVPYIRVVERNFSRGRVVINVFSPQKNVLIAMISSPTRYTEQMYQIWTLKGGGSSFAMSPPPFLHPYYNMQPKFTCITSNINRSRSKADRGSLL